MRFEDFTVFLFSLVRILNRHFVFMRMLYFWKRKSITFSYILEIKNIKKDKHIKLSNGAPNHFNQHTVWNGAPERFVFILQRKKIRRVHSAFAIRTLPEPREQNKVRLLQSCVFVSKCCQ